MDTSADDSWTTREVDNDGEPRRFESILESEVTAYHLATLRDIYLDDDSFENAGFALAGLDFDEAPVTHDDIVTVGGFTQIRQLALTDTEVTELSPVSSMRRLKKLALNRNAIPVSNMATAITAESFPDMIELSLDFQNVNINASGRQYDRFNLHRFR